MGFGGFVVKALPLGCFFGSDSSCGDQVDVGNGASQETVGCSLGSTVKT